MDELLSMLSHNMVIKGQILMYIISLATNKDM